MDEFYLVLLFALGSNYEVPDLEKTTVTSFERTAMVTGLPIMPASDNGMSSI